MRFSALCLELRRDPGTWVLVAGAVFAVAVEQNALALALCSAAYLLRLIEGRSKRPTPRRADHHRSRPSDRSGGPSRRSFR
jgi:hypothetical protein